VQHSVERKIEEFTMLFIPMLYLDAMLEMYEANLSTWLAKREPVIIMLEEEPRAA
jgi:hypothetical protein